MVESDHQRAQGREKLDAERVVRRLHFERVEGTEPIALVATARLRRLRGHRLVMQVINWVEDLTDF